MQESGDVDINVSLSVIALTNVKRGEIEGKSLSDLPVSWVFLWEDDIETTEPMERWWH